MTTTAAAEWRRIRTSVANEPRLLSGYRLPWCADYEPPYAEGADRVLQSRTRGRPFFGIPAREVAWYRTGLPSAQFGSQTHTLACPLCFMVQNRCIELRFSGTRMLALHHASDFGSSLDASTMDEPWTQGPS